MLTLNGLSKKLAVISEFFKSRGFMVERAGYVRYQKGVQGYLGLELGFLPLFVRWQAVTRMLGPGLA